MKLSERITDFRCERPSEFLMDDFAKDAARLEASLSAAEAERNQATEAVHMLAAGKPLGEVAGKHTILNQAAEIERLLAENARMRAWIDVVSTASDALIKSIAAAPLRGPVCESDILYRCRELREAITQPYRSEK